MNDGGKAEKRQIHPAATAAPSTPRPGTGSPLAAALDALTALAEAAVRCDYWRLKLVDSREMAIERGRQPVVERMRPKVPFVPRR